MRSVQIYIEDTILSDNYNELELFDDENINVSLSVQNVKDISKVFTEFSQGFTVPASPNNNAIFRHFYENSVDLDLTQIDTRIRRQAYIEIDRTFFRFGKIELEKVNIKDNKVESYSITFYGTIINLSDTFGEDKLSDLDYSSVEFSYTGTEVQNRITDDSTDYDVRYPLISSDRLWSYGDATSTDITTTSGAINYTELFPALKVPKIFDLIELKYGINFTGLFLSDPRFNDLFLYYKATKENEIKTAKDNPVITVGVNDYFKINNTGTTYFIYDDTNYTIKSVGGNYYNNAFFSQFERPGYTNSGYKQTREVILHVLSVSSGSVNYYFDIYVNGTLTRTITGTGVNSYQIAGNYEFGNIEVFAYSDSSITIDTQYESVLTTPTLLGGFYDSVFSNNAALSLSANSNLVGNAPDIKIADFVSGILKMFNLTITAETIDTFLIEPLEWWYQKGAIIDITKYVDTDSIDIARVPLYKSIEFNFQESKSALNVDYKGKYSHEYGSVKKTFEFTGNEYKIDLPFENLLQNCFETNDLQVGYCLDENLNSYVPKPILLYQRPASSTGSSTVKFDDGGTIQTLTQYIPLSQDVLYNGLEYTLNFNNEQSSLLNKIIGNTHYYIWYKNYIDNLYNYKNRLVTVKTILPVGILTNLKLNDRLIIRDKRYIINQINANLTNGEVTLELLSDLRELANELDFTLPSVATTFDYPVLLPNGAYSSTISSPTSGVTFTGLTTFTSDSIAIVNAPVNPYIKTNIDTEDGLDLITEDGFELVTEETNYNIITLIQENIYLDGNTNSTTTYIIQEP